MPSPLERIHAYYTAFSSLDLAAIVPFFCEPCLSISPAGVVSAATHADLATALTPFLDSLRGKGYGKSEFTGPQVIAVTATTVLIRGTAIRYARTGTEMERADISYLLHLDHSKWKIAVMILAS
jgi:hypothetical protein